MAGEIKPGETFYKQQHVWLWAAIADRPSACAIEHGASPDDVSAEAYVCWREVDDDVLERIDPPDDDDPDVIPHHPSLPAVAALLHDPGLAAAVKAALSALARERSEAEDDLRRSQMTGQEDEHYRRRFLERSSRVDVIERLAAALEVDNGTNG